MSPRREHLVTGEEQRATRRPIPRVASLVGTLFCGAVRTATYCCCCCWMSTVVFGEAVSGGGSGEKRGHRGEEALVGS